MSIQLLINSRIEKVAAELVSEKSITIYEQWILDSVTETGITVTREFKAQFSTDWKVYPSDDPAIFARAFKECYFKHGLQQQGYYWKAKEGLTSRNGQ